MDSKHAENRPPAEVKGLRDEAKPKSHFTSQSQSGQGPNNRKRGRERGGGTERERGRDRGRDSPNVLFKDVGQGRGVIDSNPTILAIDLQTPLPHYQIIHGQNTGEQIKRQDTRVEGLTNSWDGMAFEAQMSEINCST